MLGIPGFYQIFMSSYSDLVWPLTQLPRNTVASIWSENCQLSFEILEQALCSSLTLVYEYLNTPYALFTDALKYTWSTVLTQVHNMISNGNSVYHQYPITYASGIFQESHLNWPTLTEGTYKM